MKIYNKSGTVEQIAIGVGTYDGDVAAISTTAPLPSYTPGGCLTAGASFNRPADTLAYAIGDRIGNSTSAATVLEIPDVTRTPGDAVRIERIRIRKGSATLTNASFRAHVFRTLPTVSVQDNGVFNNNSVLALTDLASYVGSFDVLMNRSAATQARGVGLPDTGSGITTESATTNSLWIVLEALAAYTPASAETFTVVLEGARS